MRVFTVHLTFIISRRTVEYHASLKNIHSTGTCRIMFRADCVVCNFMLLMEESHKDIGDIYRLIDIYQRVR